MKVGYQDESLPFFSWIHRGLRFQTCFSHQRLQPCSPCTVQKNNLPNSCRISPFCSLFDQNGCNHMGCRGNNYVKINLYKILENSTLNINIKLKALKNKKNMMLFLRWRILMEALATMKTSDSDVDESEYDQNMNLTKTWYSLIKCPKQRGLIGSSEAFLKQSCARWEGKTVRSRSFFKEGNSLSLFIGPRCPWGPIYGSWCPSVRHHVQT